LSISLSRFGFLSNGRTIACLKDAGTHCSDSDLLTISVIDGDKFCEFFVGKISTIRDNLAATNNSSSDNCDTMRADIKFDGEPLRSFSPVSSDELRKIILAAPTKSCELDPLPTSLYQDLVS
jgi:hypothetical protein